MNPIVLAIIAKLGKLAWKHARIWAVADLKDVARWAGRFREIPATMEETLAAGFSGGRPCFRLTIDAHDPLRMIHLKSGFEYAVATDLITDFGSIPRAATIAAPEWLQLKPTDAKRSFALHDSAYRDGGVWFRENAGAEWKFIRIQRAVADMLMWQGMSGEDMNNISARAIYRAVRIGAGWSWRCHANRRANRLARK